MTRTSTWPTTCGEPLCRDQVVTEQLHELVARVLSRPLDRDRPLWEMYLVEGLADDRIALVTKTHQALVDGVGAIEIGEVLFDDEPRVMSMDELPGGPCGSLVVGRRPSAWWRGAVNELVDRPSAVVGTVQHAVSRHWSHARQGGRRDRRRPAWSPER